MSAFDTPPAGMSTPENSLPDILAAVRLAAMVQFGLRLHELRDTGGSFARMNVDAADLAGLAIYLRSRLKVPIPEGCAFEGLETLAAVAQYIHALPAQSATSADPFAYMTPGQRLAAALREDSEMRRPN